jgi:hypothetical protein
MDFFQIPSIFCFTLTARFPERASTLACPPEGSTGFLNFLFSSRAAVSGDPAAFVSQGWVSGVSAVFSARALSAAGR